MTFGLLGASSSSQAAMLIVGDLSNSSINLFDSTTGVLVGQSIVPSVAGTPSSPKGIAIGPDGGIYVADQANGVIDRFDAGSGNYIDQFVTSGGFGSLFAPIGVAFGPDGNLYVSDYGGGNLSFINAYGGPNSATPGAFLGQFVAPGYGPETGLNSPGGITFHDGNLYVADSGNGSIDEFNGSTGVFTPFVPPGNPPSPLVNPQDLAFGPDGDLYVTDLSNNVVYQYDAAGTYVGEFVSASGGLAQPMGLAFGPDGNLYVTDSLGRVAVFDGTTGVSLTENVAAGVINPQFLAFGPVAASPEPSTFVLFTVMAAVAFGLSRFRPTFLSRIKNR